MTGTRNRSWFSHLANTWPMFSIHGKVAAIFAIVLSAISCRSWRFSFWSFILMSPSHSFLFIVKTSDRYPQGLVGDNIKLNSLMMMSLNRPIKIIVQKKLKRRLGAFFQSTFSTSYDFSVRHHECRCSFKLLQLCKILYCRALWHLNSNLGMKIQIHFITAFLRLFICNYATQCYTYIYGSFHAHNFVTWRSNIFFSSD